MTRISRAERLTAYVAELETYLADHGHLPPASRSTPRFNRQRLAHLAMSPRIDDGMRQRIEALLTARPWNKRRAVVAIPKKARSATDAVLGYLDSLEKYVAEQGRLPSTHQGSEPQTRKERLHRWLENPKTDESIKDRIRALLGTPGHYHRAETLDDQSIATLKSAAAALPITLSAAQKAVLDRIISSRAVPSSGSHNRDERTPGLVVASGRRSVLQGSATLRTTEFINIIPGVFTPAEREIATSHLAAKRAAAAAAAALVAGKVPLGPLEDRWNKGFADLSAWFATHGALPRRRTHDEEEHRVANWLNVQRVQFRNGNLSNENIDRLNTVTGALSPRRGPSDLEMANGIAQFYGAHGHLPRWLVPAPECTLSGHLTKLRRKLTDGVLSPDAETVLRSVPDAAVCLPKKKKPYERLADLEAHVRRTGRFPSRGSEGLSNWSYRALRGEGSKSGKPGESADIQRKVMALYNAATNTRSAA